MSKSPALIYIKKTKNYTQNIVGDLKLNVHSSKRIN